ncbi:hypothetical protein MIMGU_mgv1a016076mg [Erythranthe guttata]|uniref:Uncharacterized protein n=1 Tax=Erythranthe guttata TaxID=4155 RepID=A0A022RID7_ERYGU|nr:hypothetical protein MIMGU_mgv1a016076mg [Erythranthe guttata]
MVGYFEPIYFLDNSLLQTCNLLIFRTYVVQRESDNFHCPTVEGVETADQKHFEWPLYKGEPVIVPNVLRRTTGLSWEPLVMWRASRKIKSTHDLRILEFSVTNCLNWCERKRSDSNNCHQCHRNGKEIVMQCPKC